MHSYQINLTSRNVDLTVALLAVSDLLIDDQDNEDSLPFVRVRLGSVVEAVKRLNAIGIATDEDDN